MSTKSEEQNTTSQNTSLTIISDFEDQETNTQLQQEKYQAEKQSILEEIFHFQNSNPKRPLGRKQGKWEESLPIFKYKEELVDRLLKLKVMICVAETGSGKTTQIPQFLGDSVKEFPKKIICTQPRTIAALQVARRVQEEYEGRTNIQQQNSVGYLVAKGMKMEGNRIVFMTEEMFINSCIRPCFWDEISAVIVDEAHERNLYTDIVLGLCKHQLQLKKDLHVVIASATIDPTPFLDFFQEILTFNAQDCIFNVEGCTFPVEEIYEPQETQSYLHPKLDVKYVVFKTIVYAMQTDKHTLIFLPGKNEIEKAIEIFCEIIQKYEECKLWKALPLYGQLLPEEQKKIFSFDEDHKEYDGQARMFVFTTNVAETSLTVPNVDLVIDSGLAKEAYYDPLSKMTVLKQLRIAKSSADQRKGRAGRTEEGICVRLYEQSELEDRESIEPQILRSSLETVILQLKRLNIDPLSFYFIDRPDEDLLKSSIKLLISLGCLDQSQQHNITKLGQFFFELPFTPHLSLFVYLCTHLFGKLDLAVGIACLLSAPGSIFFNNGATRAEKLQAKAKMSNSAANFKSDLQHIYYCYKNWQNQGSADERIKYSNENGLNNKILKIVDRTVRYVSEKFQYFKGFDLKNIPILFNSPLLQTQPHISYNLSKQSDSYALEQCLLAVFSEQLCQVNFPGQINRGLEVVATGIEAHVSFDSCAILSKNKNEITYLIACNFTQMPGGKVLAGYIHPIEELNAKIFLNTQKIQSLMDQQL